MSQVCAGAEGLIAGSATLAGTQRFSIRHSVDCHPLHFRQTRDLVLSSFGIGTALGEPNATADDQIVTAVFRSVAAGINVIDTSANYRDGRSERSIGAALRALIGNERASRDEVFIGSKCGYLPFTSGTSHNQAARYLQSIGCATAIDEVADGCHSIHPGFIAHQLAQSRANLGVETLDLYYLHNPEVQLRAVDRAEFRNRLFRAFVFLEEMCLAGAIRRYGIAIWHGLRRLSTLRTS